MWNLPSTEKILAWKNFRQKIGKLPLDEAALEVEELWSRAKPRVPYHLDVNSDSDWPDAWELLTGTKFCDLSIALGMMYTLKGSSHIINNYFSLIIAEDKNKLYNMININDTHLLGYKTGEIVPIAVLDNMTVICNKYILTKELE